MKVTISLPDPVFEAAERAAERLAVPRSQLYVRALRRYLDTLQAQDVREALASVYDAESRDLDPVLESLQAEALRETW